MIQKRKILKKDPRTGRIYLRDGITVAFFLPTPMHEIVGPLLAAFEEYLKMVPEDALRWESVGASSEEWKPINKTTLQRCRAQLKLEAVRKRKLTSFELADGDVGGDAPGYGILVIGNPIDPDTPDELSLMQMYLPIEVIEQEQVELFVEHIRTIAALLPYKLGYTSPALQWAELGMDKAIAQSRAIVARHPGYDIQLNETGRTWLGLRARGARWLNFLGPEIVDKLGGIEALKKTLKEPIVVEPIGHGIMIRAGEKPEIGDVPRKVGTPLLRSVAKVLEPVTAFEEIVLLGSFANWDKDFLEQWEHRFLN